MSISLNDLSTNPEPYHEFIVKLYNNNEKAINNAINNMVDEGGNVNMLVWVNLLSVLIISIEDYKKLTGSLKKRIVIEACLIAVDKSSMNDNTKSMIKLLLYNFVPGIIDTIVNLSNKINLDSKCGGVIKKILMCVCRIEIPQPKTELVKPEEPENNY